MRELSRRRRIALVACVAAFAIVFLSACDDFETSTELASDFFDDFKGNQTSSEQNADATSRTGDEAVDGILDSLDTMNEIQKAEAIYQPVHVDANNGRNLNTVIPKVDEAIALRPDDLRYRRTRARAALWANDGAAASEQWAQMDRIAVDQGFVDDLWYWEGATADAGQGLIDMLTAAGGDPLNYTYEEDARAIAVYGRLADTVERMAAINALLGDTELADKQLEQAAEYRLSVKEHGG